MAGEIYPHRVWAAGTGVDPGILRFAHYEIAGVKYADLLVYAEVDGVRAWRATVRLKGSEIDDLVLALVPDMTAARRDALTMRGVHAIDEPPADIQDR
jgi:hypothetical protein